MHGLRSANSLGTQYVVVPRANTNKLHQHLIFSLQKLITHGLRLQCNV